MIRATHSVARLVAMVVVVGAVSGVATAQPTKAPVEPTLKGPEVKDRNVPGVDGDFGMGAEKRKYAPERIPPEVFRKAVQSLSDPNAPADIKASPETQAKIMDLVSGFEREVRKYREEHRKEIEELRKQGVDVRPGAKGAAGKGKEESMQEMSADEMKQHEAARVRLRELMEGAPKIESVYTRVWLELSPAQHAAVEAKLDEWRQEEAKKREDNYVRQRTKKKAPATSPENPDVSEKPAVEKATPGPSKADGPRVNPERRERLMKFFEKLTPEEQEQLLQRLEQRFSERGAVVRPGANGKTEKTDGKPAPNPDRVKVPKADE